MFAHGSRVIQRRASLLLFILPSLAAAVLAPAVAEAQATKPHPGMTVVEHGGQGAMVVLDLCAPGASIVTTRYADRKATPQEWAAPKGIEAATNADFFDNPGWTLVVGRARAQGEDWPANAQWKEKDRPYWQFGSGIVDGIANGLTTPKPGASEIIGGHNVIIAGGKTTGPWALANDGALLNNAYTRTAFGASADRRTVYAIATRDRLSAQALVGRMQAWAAEAGAPPIDFATNMDGGGSSQLYVKGRGQIVSTGRQVNNHIGFVAKGTGPSPMCLARFAADTKDFAPKGDVITMKVGEKVDGYVDVVNNGTQTWVPGVTKLAPLPRDKPTDVGGKASGWLEPHRVSSVSAPVKPGEVGRFALPLAPTKAGDFVQAFGFVHEGETWFSEDEVKVHLVVTPSNGTPATAETPGGAASSDPNDDARSATSEGEAEEDGCAVAHPRERGALDPSTAVVAALVVLAARRRRRS